jgi:hypothetical protein
VVVVIPVAIVAAFAIKMWIIYLKNECMKINEADWISLNARA